MTQAASIISYRSRTRVCVLSLVLLTSHHPLPPQKYCRLIFLEYFHAIEGEAVFLGAPPYPRKSQPTFNHHIWIICHLLRIRKSRVAIAANAALVAAADVTPSTNKYRDFCVCEDARRHRRRGPIATQTVATWATSFPGNHHRHHAQS